MTRMNALTSSSFRCVACLISLFGFLKNSQAQFFNSPAPFKNYYYDYKLANPAFTGAKGNHVINTVAAGDLFESYPGAPRKFYGSYEASLKKFNTGLGVLIVDDRIGIHTYNKYSLFYKRTFNFDENTSISFGSEAMYQRQKQDFSLPDPKGNDPIPAGYENKKDVNLGVGVLLRSHYINVGVCSQNMLNEKFDRTNMNIILSREFKLTNSIQATPSLFYLTDFTEQRFSVNNIFRIKKSILLGAGYTFPREGYGDLNVNIGIDILGWVEVVTHVYSSAFQRLSSYSAQYVETMIQVKIPGGFENEAKK
jgi:type IX secretion system PorP/SprF family membrane protein